MPDASDIAGMSPRLRSANASAIANNANVTSVTSEVGAITFAATGTGPRRRAKFGPNGVDVLSFLPNGASNGTLQGGLIATDTTKGQTLLTGTGFSVAFVAQINDAGFGAFMNKGPAGDRTSFFHFGTNLSTLDGKIGIWSTLKTTANFNDGKYHLFVFVVNTVANTGKIYVDNVLVASGPIANLDADAASGWALGTMSQTNGQLSACMNLVEMLGYNSELGSVDLNTLSVYVQDAYGIAAGGTGGTLVAPVISAANLASCRVNVLRTNATGGTGGFTYKHYRTQTPGTAAEIAVSGNLIATTSSMKVRQPHMGLTAGNTYYIVTTVTDASNNVALSNVLTVNTPVATAAKVGIAGDSNNDPGVYNDNAAIQFAAGWNTAHPDLPITLTNLALSGQKTRNLSRALHIGGTASDWLIADNIETYLAANVTHVIFQQLTNDRGNGGYTKEDGILDMLDVKNACLDAGIVFIVNHMHYQTGGTDPVTGVPAWNALISAQTFTSFFRLGNTLTYPAIALSPGTYMLDVVHLNPAGRTLDANNWLTTVMPGIYADLASGSVATPVFTPGQGTFPSAQSVTLSCGTSGATIRYTTDNSTPTGTSPIYSSAIPVTATTTIKARAFKALLTDSAVATATFTITPSVTSITVDPDEVIMAGGSTQQFTATLVTVGGASNAVTWSKTGVGSISAGGLYTSPAGIEGVAQSAVVRATSVFDPTKFVDVDVTIPALPSGGGGDTLIIYQVFTMGDFPQSATITPLRLTSGDTSGALSMPLINDAGGAIMLTGQEVVTFNLRLKGESTSVIDDAEATLTAPDRFGIRAVQFDFTEEIPVPDEGEYEATFQVAGLTYPVGRKQPVRVQGAI